MKSSAELGSSARHADTAAHFIARDDGGEKPFAVDFTRSSNQRVCGWYCFRAGMYDPNPVKVIHFEAVNKRAVGKRRVGAGDLGAIAPDERSLSFSHLLRKRSNYFSPGQSRTKESAAKRIDDAELDVRDHFVGNGSIRQSRYVFR